jgi:serpin B
MTAAGARGNTEREMATVLHFPTEDVAGKASFISRERVGASCASLQEDLVASRETRGYELHIANSLWGQHDYPFKMSFLDLIERHFGGGFNVADFVGNAEAERVRINQWVEGETREKIEDLIPPGGVDGLTTLVLTNAIYFKGQWAARFDEEKTTEATFHGAHGDATVPMMHQKGDFQYLENDVVQVLEMPYVGEEISMLVLLPRTGGSQGLEVLEASLTPEMLSDWSGRLRELKLKVYFPRFEMTWGTEEISRHLAALGIRDAFGARADFSGMSDLQDLFIDSVFHKAFVAVNEEGTEAAAATAVVMARLAIMEEETIFRADRPFLFVIRDNASGSILFMGRVVDLG